MTKGKTKEALLIFKKIANSNKREFFVTIDQVSESKNKLPIEVTYLPDPKRSISFFNVYHVIENILAENENVFQV